MLVRKEPASAVVWAGDNFDEVKEFLGAEDNEIIRDGLNLIIDDDGRKMEVLPGWYIILEELPPDMFGNFEIKISCGSPEFVSEFYEIF